MAEDRTEKYVYDENDLSIKIIYGDNTYEERIYDTWQNLVYVKNRLGNITRYVYNIKGFKL